MLFYTLLVFAVVNLAHTLGHLLGSRVFGVGLYRVSLGIGPTLWQTRVRGVVLRVALLPVGLFVRLRQPWSRKEPDAWPPAQPEAFANQPWSRRLGVVCMAPAAVLLVVYAMAWLQSGVPRPEYSEASLINVIPGKPAALAGVRYGDRIITIDGKQVSRWADVVAGMAGVKGDTVAVAVLRKGKRLTFQVTPERYGKRAKIGVSPMLILQRPPSGRVIAAARTVYQGLTRMTRSLWRTLVGREVVTLSGPVLLHMGPPRPPNIAAAQHRYALVTGLSQWSILLLLFCLLPLTPYLDGRRILFLLLEGILRKPLHPRFEQWYNRVMLVVFVSLPFLATLSDLRRFFG